MPFDALRNNDDPGIAHIDRLACGGAIDIQIRRRSDWPERAMRWIWRGMFVGLGLAVAIRVALS